MLVGMRNAMLLGGGSQPSGGYWGLCFTAEEANSTVAMTATGSAPSVSLLYSTDAANWSPFVVGTTTVTLASVGDKVWIKAGTGGNTAMASGANIYNRFSLSGRIAASGSIMSLLDGDTEIIAFPAVNAMPNLFNGCTSLTAAPTLPATTLTQNCYFNMFNGCTSLTVAPDLPATTMANACYRQMFMGCTSLTVAPDLPATTTTGFRYCYAQMFFGCSALASIKVGLTSFLNNSNWLYGVAATGTFYCPTALGTNATITRGTSYCPEGWTVINTDA